VQAEQLRALEVTGLDAVAWQVYDAKGNPTAARGKVARVPTWSLVAVFARPDGAFTVVS
jgi:hypothetical protein